MSHKGLHLLIALFILITSFSFSSAQTTPKEDTCDLGGFGFLMKSVYERAVLSIADCKDLDCIAKKMAPYQNSYEQCMQPCSSAGAGDVLYICDPTIIDLISNEELVKQEILTSMNPNTLGALAESGNQVLLLTAPTHQELVAAMKEKGTSLDTARLGVFAQEALTAYYYMILATWVNPDKLGTLIIYSRDGFIGRGFFPGYACNGETCGTFLVGDRGKFIDPKEFKLIIDKYSDQAKNAEVTSDQTVKSFLTEVLQKASPTKLAFQTAAGSKRIDGSFTATPNVVGPDDVATVKATWTGNSKGKIGKVVARIRNDVTGRVVDTLTLCETYFNLEIPKFYEDGSVVIIDENKCNKKSVPIEDERNQWALPYEPGTYTVDLKFESLITWDPACGSQEDFTDIEKAKAAGQELLDPVGCQRTEIGSTPNAGKFTVKNTAPIVYLDLRESDDGTVNVLVSGFDPDGGNGRGLPQSAVFSAIDQDGNPIHADETISCSDSLVDQGRSIFDSLINGINSGVSGAGWFNNWVERYCYGTIPASSLRGVKVLTVTATIDDKIDGKGLTSPEVTEDITLEKGLFALINADTSPDFLPQGTDVTLTATFSTTTASIDAVRFVIMKGELGFPDVSNLDLRNVPMRQGIYGPVPFREVANFEVDSGTDASGGPNAKSFTTSIDTSELEGNPIDYQIDVYGQVRMPDEQVQWIRLKDIARFGICQEAQGNLLFESRICGIIINSDNSFVRPKYVLLGGEDVQIQIAINSLNDRDISTFHWELARENPDRHAMDVGSLTPSNDPDGDGVYNFVIPNTELQKVPYGIYKLTIRNSDGLYYLGSIYFSDGTPLKIKVPSDAMKPNVVKDANKEINNPGARYNIYFMPNKYANEDGFVRNVKTDLARFFNLQLGPLPKDKDGNPGKMSFYADKFNIRWIDLFESDLCDQYPKNQKIGICDPDLVEKIAESLPAYDALIIKDNQGGRSFDTGFLGTKQARVPQGFDLGLQQINKYIQLDFQFGDTGYILSHHLGHSLFRLPDTGCIERIGGECTGHYYTQTDSFLPTLFDSENSCTKNGYVQSLGGQCRKIAEDLDYWVYNEQNFVELMASSSFGSSFYQSINFISDLARLSIFDVQYSKLEQERIHDILKRS